MVRNGGVARDIRCALKAYRSSQSNQPPLRYAPWVLSLLMVILMRERLTAFSLEAWGWVAVAMLGMLFLAGQARAALERQRTQAVSRLYQLLRRPGAAEAMLSLQTSHPGLARTKLPDDLQHAIIQAVRQLETEREHRRRHEQHARQGVAV